MSTIAKNILGRLGRAVEITTAKSDLFITKPELANWAEMYNMKMVSRGLDTDNAITGLFDKKGGLTNDDKAWEEAFAVYNTIYMYNLEKQAVLRNKDTGISLINPYDYGFNIPTKLRASDRSQIVGAVSEDDTSSGRPTDRAAKNIYDGLTKKKVEGVANSDN